MNFLIEGYTSSAVAVAAAGEATQKHVFVYIMSMNHRVHRKFTCHFLALGQSVNIFFPIKRFNFVHLSKIFLIKILC